MTRLILFLIRRKLKVHKYECFRFTNQKDKCVYFFNNRNLIKVTETTTTLSGVSLNWLLSKECKSVIF